MNKKTLLVVAAVASLCNAQELNSTLKYDVNGNVLCDSNGYYFSRNGDKISRLTFFDEKHVKKIMALLNKNYQAPQICFDGYGILLMIVSTFSLSYSLREEQ